jgi:hypothetical protein
MANSISLLIATFLFGAAVVWLGRTYFVLMASYFATGVVGVAVIYTGYDVFHLATYGKTFTGEIENEFLSALADQFISFELNEWAIIPFLTQLDEQQRTLAVFLSTATTLIVTTLPFMIFANSVYSIRQSRRAEQDLDSSIESRIEKALLQKMNQ